MKKFSTLRAKNNLNEKQAEKPTEKPTEKPPVKPFESLIRIKKQHK